MCVAFLALGATVTAQQQRVSVSIDLGWRFYYGTPNDQCNTLFNQNYTVGQAIGQRFSCCGVVCCSLLSLLASRTADSYLMLYHAAAAWKV